MLLAALLALPCRAQDRWAVMTTGGAQTAHAVEFTADGSGVVCRTVSGAATPLAFSSVVALRPRAPARGPLPVSAARRFYAELASGERMLADGVEMEHGALRITNSRWGSVNLSTVAVWRVAADDTQLPAVPEGFAGVRYVNGDAAEGAIASITRDTVMVEMPGIGKIPIEGFASIGDLVFQKSRPPRSGPRGTEVFLRTGELLHGRIAGGTAWSLRLKTAWAVEPLVIPLDMVAAVGVLEGRAVLSDTTPKSVVEKPFLGFQRPWRRNRALTGGVLTADGFPAALGLALHTKTALDFTVPAVSGGSVLVAWVGVDDVIPPGAATAEVRICVDGEVKSGLQVRAGGGLLPLRVDIPANAVTLSITADYGADGSAGDHVDILYPCWVTR